MERGWRTSSRLRKNAAFAYQHPCLGRDAHYCAPPAQNRTCPIRASGSHLGVGDGETLFRPRMSDARFGEPLGDEPVDRRPGGAIVLAAAAKAPPPQPADAAPERAQRLDVVGHGMIGKIASHNLPQPGALLVDRRVQAAAQGFFDFAQPGPQPVAPRLPAQGKLANPGAPTQVGVSRPAELHRQPLAEPSVRLSPHSAPIRQTCRSSRSASARRVLRCS